MQRITNPIFAGYSDAVFENKSINISVQLANKTIFHIDFPQLDALTATVKTFSELLVLSMEGSKIAIAKKNATRKTIEKLLKQAASYVCMVAGDDTSVVITAGFEPTKPRQARPA